MTWVPSPRDGSREVNLSNGSKRWCGKPLPTFLYGKIRTGQVTTITVLQSTAKVDQLVIRSLLVGAGGLSLVPGFG